MTQTRVSHVSSGRRPGHAVPVSLRGFCPSDCQSFLSVCPALLFFSLAHSRHRSCLFSVGQSCLNACSKICIHQSCKSVCLCHCRLSSHACMPLLQSVGVSQISMPVKQSVYKMGVYSVHSLLSSNVCMPRSEINRHQSCLYLCSEITGTSRALPLCRNQQASVVSVSLFRNLQAPATSVQNISHNCMSVEKAVSISHICVTARQPVRSSHLCMSVLQSFVSHVCTSI